MVRRQAANVVRAAHLPTSRRIAAGLSHSDLKYAASIVLEGRALERARLQRLLGHIRVQLEAVEPDGRIDPVLDRIVRTAICDSDDFARSNALGILMLLPQRAEVAPVVAQEFSHSVTAGDEVGVTECTSVLSWILFAEDAAPIVDRLVDESSPANLILECGIPIGNARDDDAVRANRVQMRIHARAVRVIGGADVCGSWSLEETRQALRGLVYALGMPGRFDLIADLRARAEASSVRYAGLAAKASGQVQYRRVASMEVATGVCDWWLTIPEHIRPWRAP
jgi:hypothetical protein